MNDIILSMQNGEPVVSSRQIAESFEKRHDHVMRDIEDIMRGLPKNGDTPIPSASFDIWVAKCVCLCRTTDRNVPEFIIKKAGECL